MTTEGAGWPHLSADQALPKPQLSFLYKGSRNPSPKGCGDHSIPKTTSNDWTVSVQQMWFLSFTGGRVTILSFLAEAFPYLSRNRPTLVWPAAQLQDSLVVVKAVLGSQVGAHRWTVLGAFADDPGLTVEADLSGEGMGWDLHKATWGGDGLELHSGHLGKDNWFL